LHDVSGREERKKYEVEDIDSFAPILPALSDQEGKATPEGSSLKKKAPEDILNHKGQHGHGRSYFGEKSVVLSEGYRVIRVCGL